MKKTAYIASIVTICLLALAGSSLSQVASTEGSEVLIGEVLDINIKTSTVTVIDEEGRERMLTVDAQEVAIWKRGTPLTLEDLRVGEKICLECYSQGGTTLANWIEIIDLTGGVPSSDQELDDVEMDVYQTIEADRQRDAEIGANIN